MEADVAAARGGQPVFVSGEAVSVAVELPEAIAAIREAYSVPIEPGAAPPRAVARSQGARLRTLTAIMASHDVMGVKLLTQPRSGRPTSLIVLLDQGDGRLLALLDGEVITAVATAATSAVAVDALAPGGPLRLGVLGSGAQARAHVRALAAIRPLEALAVFSPRAEHRDAFASWAQEELRVAASAAADARAVVDGATTVVAATRTHDAQPVLDANWLAPDALVVSIGSNLPEQRELDVATLARASLIVTDLHDEFVAGSGDGIAAAAAQQDLTAKTRSLQQLIQGLVERGQPPGIAVYKSVGAAVQELAVARLALSGAQSRGLNLTFAEHVRFLF